MEKEILVLENGLNAISLAQYPGKAQDPLGANPPKSPKSPDSGHTKAASYKDTLA